MKMYIQEFLWAMITNILNLGLLYSLHIQNDGFNMADNFFFNFDFSRKIGI